MDIKIEIDDKHTYAQIAYFLDSTGVANDIIELRKQYNLTSFFEYEDFDSWDKHLYKLAGYDLSKLIQVNKIDSTNEKEIIIQSLKNYEHNDKILSSDERKHAKYTELKNNFNLTITTIRKKYKYPFQFESVIEQAMLFNKVGSFTSAKVTFNKSDDGEITNMIIFSPTATKEDILEAFDSREILSYIHEEFPLNEKVKNVFKKSAIKNARKWYLMQTIEKKGYKKIAKETGINLETIKSGIKSYKEFLHQ